MVEASTSPVMIGEETTFLRTIAEEMTPQGLAALPATLGDKVNQECPEAKLASTDQYDYDEDRQHVAL
jgi:hypothetical protein